MTVAVTCTEASISSLSCSLPQMRTFWYAVCCHGSEVLGKDAHVV